MIALYRGVSSVSRVIRFVTWSAYSHASWISPNGDYEVESWIHGVQWEPGLGSNHTPGTVVDLFQVRDITVEQDDHVEAFLRDQVGKDYDWTGLFNFITRKPQTPEQQDKWFCSELIFAAHASAGIRLLRDIAYWKVSPGLLSLSPLLELVRTIEVEPVINLEEALS